MQFSFLLAALAISASAAPTPQLKAQVLNDVVDVDSDNLAGLSALLGGLGITLGTDAAPLKVLTPIGPGVSGPSLPGTKTKRQLNAQVLNDVVDVNSDNLAGLSALLGGLGITLGTDAAPLKVLTPIGPGVSGPSLPGTKTKRQLNAQVLNDVVDVNSDNLAGLSALLGGLGITLGTDAAPLKILTPIGPDAPSLPGKKTKRQLNAQVLNDVVDVNSDNLAGLSALLGGLGITLGTDAAPLKVLTPIGPGAPTLPGTKREAEAEEKNA